ncbi:MAG: zinc-ribbon domain-containing protein [Caldicoprobacterales bacterium]|nr:zinc ribbon domain-containing protein [Clostridiales bacterium]
MERFDTLLEAAEFAATLCNSWSFAFADERYDAEGLLVLAETSDSEDPIDEDSFYVVSPTGAIGLCEGGEDIDWLFLSDAAPDEDLPLIYQVVPQMKFCPKCGSPTIPGARFCSKCGIALRSL